jgi:hypothetical protein
VNCVTFDKELTMTIQIASAAATQSAPVAGAQTARSAEQEKNGLYLKGRGDEPWRLLGYRLGEQPLYETIAPDPDGRVTFTETGLQFEAIGRERINVYDLATGSRLLTLEEQKAYADSEAAARAAAEARVRELEELLRQAGLQP